jgi:hypothetical protein
MIALIFIMLVFFLVGTDSMVSFKLHYGVFFAVS